MIPFFTLQLMLFKIKAILFVKECDFGRIMSNQEDLWTYYKNIISKEIFPCLILDLDLFKKNISDVATRLKKNTNNDKTIRIASKSIRSVKILQLLLDSDEIYKGILSYSLREALFLVSKGFKNIVVAYPEINKNDIEQLCLEKTKKVVDITLIVDSEEQVKKID